MTLKDKILFQRDYNFDKQEKVNAKDKKELAKRNQKLDTLLNIFSGK